MHQVTQGDKIKYEIMLWCNLNFFKLFLLFFFMHYVIQNLMHLIYLLRLL